MTELKGIESQALAALRGKARTAGKRPAGLDG